MWVHKYHKLLKKIIYTVLIISILTGCSYQQPTDTNSELQNSHYKQGQQFLREGLYGRALSEFLSVLQTSTEASESHLEIGRLYLSHLQDPIGAIYHFKKYLEYKSHSEKAVLVRQLIQTAEKAFAKQLPGNPFENEVDRFDMMETLHQLRQENIALKREIYLLRQKHGTSHQEPSITNNETLQGQKPQSMITPATNFPLAMNTQPKTYIISSGDTLSRISTKVYGVANRWEAIYEANKAALENPHNLKLGQELIIP